MSPLRYRGMIAVLSSVLTHPYKGHATMQLSLPHPMTLLACLSLLILLSGCTINTYPDGHRETVLGAPGDETPTRYSPGVILDETGEPRAISDAPR